MTEKPLVWLGDSREAIRAFPGDARQIAGFQLWRIQNGLEPNDWKSMPSVGLGVQEIRIHTGAEHRVFYIAKFAQAVYVLHAFQKKSTHGIATPQTDIELIKRRLKQAVEISEAKE